MADSTPKLAEILDAAQKSGAKAAECLLFSQRGVRVRLERGQSPKVTPFHQDNLTVRVWLEGGQAGVASGPLGDAEAVMGESLVSAQVSTPNPFAGPVGRARIATAGLGIADRRYDQLTDSDRIDVVRQAEKGAKGAERRVLPRVFDYEDSKVERTYVSTRDLSYHEVSTRYSAGGVVEVPNKFVLSDVIEARTYASIASLPYGTLMGQRASALLQDGEPLPAGPVRVTLQPQAVGRIFALIASGFDARSLARGETFLADPELQLSPELHLLDDGGLPGAMRTRQFDDRGSPPVPLPLIKEGRVNARFLDPEMARSEGVVATGHFWRGRLVPSNLGLKSGTRSISASLSDLGGMSLQVEHIPDLSGINLKTGEMDLVVHGLVMNGNKPMGGMIGARLKGRLQDVFASVVQVTSNTDRIGHVDAPGLIVDGFELIG